MPTAEQNLRAWGKNYDWDKKGDEWSAAWGGAEAQWFGAIFPRIHAFIPTAHILEIAPGFGRWTNYLRHHCRTLAVVDLAENCISACQQRFASDSHISYYVNDGKSLEMIPDGSVDFAFSFDSLVHAEADVMDAYLRQLAMKLTANGVGFLHHSNIGAYKNEYGRMKSIPALLKPALARMGYIDPSHWRAFSMTAQLFNDYCDRYSLRCISQELINWGSTRLIDSLSLFTKKDSVWARPSRVVRNAGFMKEAESIRRWSQIYTAASFRVSR